MAMALGVNAQHDTVAAADTSRWDFHLSTGTSMVSVGGKGNAYMWVAPSVDYRASERLTLRGGFVAAGSLLGGYELRGNSRSLAPVRRGTQLMGASVGADYQASDRLTLWATLTHVGGWHEPLWTPFDESLGVRRLHLRSQRRVDVRDALPFRPRPLWQRRSGHPGASLLRLRRADLRTLRRPVAFLKLKTEN